MHNSEHRYHRFLNYSEHRYHRSPLLLIQVKISIVESNKKINYPTYALACLGKVKVKA